MLGLRTVSTRPLLLRRTANVPNLGRSILARQAHTANTSSPKPKSSRGRWCTRILGSSTLLLAGTAITLDQTDSSLLPLIRTYAVYSVISVPWFVDNAPALLEACLSIPILGSLTEWAVRHTFFAQFVGGDSVTECTPLLHELRKRNTGVLFNYSVEVEEPTTSSAESPSSGPPPHEQILEELLRSIDVSADFEDSLANRPHQRRTWVAVKVTALLPDPNALVRFSEYLIHYRQLPKAAKVAFPGTPSASDMDVVWHRSATTGDISLSSEDIASIRDLYNALDKICTRAQERNVRIMIDAEYSWYQPAIDALTYALTRRFNARPPKPSSSSRPKIEEDSEDVQPLVYGTYQAYLRRTLEHLEYSLEDAKKHNYVLGVKLVRGAYHHYEVEQHERRRRRRHHHQRALTSSPPAASSSSHAISPEELPPVWETKEATDACYDACAALIVRALAPSPRDAPVGVMFGTHNVESCSRVLWSLVEVGLASASMLATSKDALRLSPSLGGRLTFGQLYGMSDALSDDLIECTKGTEAPVVIKYLPYGALREVMPYLSRRAVENRTVLGGQGGGAAAERERAWTLIRKRLGF